MEDVAATREAELKIPSFDGVVGRRIIDTHIWAVREGLRGATAYELFDNYCQRLVIHGVPLWRAHAAMETLHPQWSGYGYTWRRDLNAIQPERYTRSEFVAQDWLSSPMYSLIGRAHAGEDEPWMRRRLEGRAGATRFPGAGGVFCAGRDGLFRATLQPSVKTAILHRAPASFIPSRPIARADSMMTIWSCCGRHCRRCRSP